MGEISEEFKKAFEKDSSLVTNYRSILEKIVFCNEKSENIFRVVLDYVESNQMVRNIILDIIPKFVAFLRVYDNEFNGLIGRILQARDKIKDGYILRAK